MARSVGIDFGTTYCAAALGGADAVEEMLPVPGDTSGRGVFPSVIAFPPESSPVFGWDALTWQERDASRCVVSIKRAISKGRGHSSFDTHSAAGLSQEAVDGEMPFLAVGGALKSPGEITALLLKEIHRRAETFCETRISQAVIGSSPAWDAETRNCILKAAEEAGFSEIRLVEESKLVLAAYLQRDRAWRRLAICDFGSGHFGFSVFERANPETDIMTLRPVVDSADAEIAGDEINGMIARYLIEQIRAETATDISKDAELMSQLLREVEKAKCAVSHRGSYDMSIRDKEKGFHYSRAVSRFEVAEYAGTILGGVADSCQKALRQATFRVDDIDTVILVGGVSRMPLVRTLVENVFHKDVFCDWNPDIAVALGAARVAGRVFAKDADA
ncbi:MAG: Hsp70 family protein [Candidatus Omnitrophota bacterium]|nr:Hsp70 family protein [Candidatus Omnitrophota bacterium]